MFGKNASLVTAWSGGIKAAHITGTAQGDNLWNFFKKAEMLRGLSPAGKVNGLRHLPRQAGSGVKVFSGFLPDFIPAG
ncbi:hypothetical protein [Mesorhizobium sp. IMUNJ 23232]|uniref:hypothetical protein n=1 Tax=Mesorhizobium sp. IMUNJ 23232 TaxID=3376064 RepID=UPI00378E4848